MGLRDILADPGLAGVAAVLKNRTSENMENESTLGATYTAPFTGPQFTGLSPMLPGIPTCLIARACSTGGQFATVPQSQLISMPQLVKCFSSLECLTDLPS